MDQKDPGKSEHRGYLWWLKGQHHKDVRLEQPWNKICQNWLFWRRPPTLMSETSDQRHRQIEVEVEEKVEAV